MVLSVDREELLRQFGENHLKVELKEVFVPQTIYPDSILHLKRK